MKKFNQKGNNFELGLGSQIQDQGKKIVFSSNRNNGETRYTNLFIADWVD